MPAPRQAQDRTPRNLLGVLTAATILFGVCAPQAFAETRPVTVLVQGQPLVSPVAPMVVADRTLVPVRFVSEAVGAQVEWNGAAQQVTIRRGADTLELWLGSQNAMFNGQKLTMDVPAQLIAERTMVPIRFIAETLGYDVDWDQATYTANINNGPHITGIAISGSKASPVIDIASNQPLEFKAFALSNPNRIVIDMPGAAFQQAVLPTTNFAGDYLTSVRTGRPDTNTARLVVDLKAAQSYQVTKTASGLRVEFMNRFDTLKVDRGIGTTTLSFVGSLPSEAKVSVTADKKTLIVEVPNSATTVAPRTFLFHDGSEATITSQNRNGNAIFTVGLPYYMGHTIVKNGSDKTLAVELVTSPVYQRRIWVDAGHGGGDPGALGRTYGVRERDVNLAISLELEKMLEAAGAKVWMTRKGEYGVDFTERPAEVNAVAPAIEAFVSVHHNAMPGSSQVSGIETYYYTGQSKTLAAALHKGMVQGLGLKDRNIRTMDFWVVKYTKAPAVLVELGYLTNPAEEKKMTDPGYPETAASALLNGFFGYFRTSPPSPEQTRPAPEPPAAPATSVIKVGDTVTVAANGDGLNLRQAPTTSAAVLSELRDGTKLKVLAIQGEWLKVAFNETQGFVFRQYVSK